MLKSLRNSNIICNFALPKGGGGLARSRYGARKRTDARPSNQMKTPKNFMPKLLRVSLKQTYAKPIRQQFPRGFPTMPRSPRNAL